MGGVCHGFYHRGTSLGNPTPRGSGNYRGGKLWNKAHEREKERNRSHSLTMSHVCTLSLTKNVTFRVLLSLRTCALRLSFFFAEVQCGAHQTLLLSQGASGSRDSSSKTWFRPCSDSPKIGNILSLRLMLVTVKVKTSSI